MTTPAPSESPPLRGNFVSEWFGHRVHPTVADTTESLTDQEGRRCPFLSRALSAATECVKTESAKGICTISYAVKIAPEVAIAEGRAASAVTTTIRRRLAAWWPALAPTAMPRRGRRQT